MMTSGPPPNTERAAKQDLTLDQLKKEPGEFCKSVCEQLADMDIRVDFANDDGFHLVLDDRRIMDEEDISLSNGKYFFNSERYWPKAYIPHANSPGVYFFFDKEDIALYVGKSEVGIGKRVDELVRRIKNRSSSDKWLENAKEEYVVTIPFVVAPGLGVAFESYLLSKYSLKWNTALNKAQKPSC